MFKAVFLDYTGTMVREDDSYTQKLLKIFLTQSDLKDPTEGLRLVWELIKRSEWEHYLETFIRKDEMVDRKTKSRRLYYDSLSAFCFDNRL